jgi:hypothetical protein
LTGEFLIDFSFFYDFFDTHYNNLITDVAALKPGCREEGVNYKRAYLHKQAEKARAFVRHATDDTILTLFGEARKAL